MDENKTINIKDQIVSALSLLQNTLGATEHIEEGLNGSVKVTGEAKCSGEDHEPGVIELLERLRTRAEEIDSRICKIADMF